MAYPSPEAIKKMYEARDRFIEGLRKKKHVTRLDLEKTDRIGRFRIADELWRWCVKEVQHDLLFDMSHSVRSAALISSQRALD